LAAVTPVRRGRRIPAWKYIAMILQAGVTFAEVGFLFLVFTGIIATD
jgi:hypothetical protein